MTGENVIAAGLWFSNDSLVPLHHHESEQISLIIEDSMKFDLESLPEYLASELGLKLPLDEA